MNTGGAIYGAGGQARVVASILRALQIDWQGFFDDSYDPNQPEEIIQGRPLRGSFKAIQHLQPPGSPVYLALGDNTRRRQAFDWVAKAGFRMPPLVHPRALVEADVAPEVGSIVCLGAILATEVRVGRGCILNTGCVVDHESRIEDFVHLAPGVAVAGRCTIGRGSFVGMNACIADGVTVGPHCVIGAGAIVLGDVAEGARVVGVYRRRA